jgi:hypothetical protein
MRHNVEKQKAAYPDFENSQGPTSASAGVEKIETSPPHAAVPV